MTTPSSGKPFSPPVALGGVGELNGRPADAATSIEEPPEFWQARLQGMQELICELLFKNQQLRMEAAGMSAKKGGPGYGLEA